MNFSKWAIVGFKDDTGIGRMTQDIQKVLGIGYHLVAPSERMETKPLHTEREFLMSKDTEKIRLLNFMEGLKGIICLERLHWNADLIPLAKDLGLKIVCVPMWEWFRGTDESWKDADLFVCPNKKAKEVLNTYGFYNAVQLSWPLDLEQLPERKVNGPARVFIHNAGLVDNDDRKETRSVIKAFSRVREPGLRLILRIQKQAYLEIDDHRIDLRIENLKDPAKLYREGDVSIQPSSMEGLGFMVLEPVCCGLPVITTDAAPMSEYVCQPEMRAKSRILRKKSFAYRSAKISHAILHPPSIKSLVRKIEWCAKNDLDEISSSNRHLGITEYNRGKLISSWSKTLAQLG